MSASFNPAELSQGLHDLNDKLMVLSVTQKVGTDSFSKEITKLRKELNQKVNEVNIKLQGLPKAAMTREKLEEFRQLSLEVTSLDSYINFLNEEIKVLNEKNQAKSPLPKIIYKLFFNQNLIANLKKDTVLSPFLTNLQNSQKRFVSEEVQQKMEKGPIEERLKTVSKSLQDGEKAWAVREQEDKVELLVAEPGQEPKKFEVKIHSQGLFVQEGIQGSKQRTKHVFKSLQDIITHLGGASLREHEIKAATNSVLKHPSLYTIDNTQDAVALRINSLHQTNKDCFVLWQDDKAVPHLSLSKGGVIEHYDFDFEKEPGKIHLKKGDQVIGPITIDEFVKECPIPLQEKVLDSPNVQAKREFFNVMKDKFYPDSLSDSGTKGAKSSADMLINKMVTPSYYLAPVSMDPEQCSKMVLVTFEKSRGLTGAYIKETREEISFQQAEQLNEKIQGKVPLKDLEGANRAELEKIKAKHSEVLDQAKAKGLFVSDKQNAEAHIKVAEKLGDCAKGAVALYEDQGKLFIRSYGKDGKVSTHAIFIEMRDGEAKAIVGRAYLENFLADAITIPTVEKDNAVWTAKYAQLKEDATQKGIFAEKADAVKFLAEANKFLKDQAKGVAVLYEDNAKLNFGFIDGKGNVQNREIEIRVLDGVAQVVAKSRRIEAPYQELITQLQPRQIAQVKADIETSKGRIEALKTIFGENFDKIVSTKTKNEVKNELSSAIALLGKKAEGAFKLYQTEENGPVHLAFVKGGAVATQIIDVKAIAGSIKIGDITFPLTDANSFIEGCKRANIELSPKWQDDKKLAFDKRQGLRDLEKNSFDDPNAGDDFSRLITALNMPAGGYVMKPEMRPDKEKTGIVFAYVVTADNQLAKYKIDVGSKPGFYKVEKEEPIGSTRFIDMDVGECQDVESLKEKLGLKQGLEALKKFYAVYQKSTTPVFSDKDFIAGARSPEDAAWNLIGHTMCLDEVASGGWLIRADVATSEQAGVASGVLAKLPELRQTGLAAWFRNAFTVGKFTAANKFVISVLVKGEEPGLFALEEHNIKIDPKTLKFVCNNKEYDSVPEIVKALENEKLVKAAGATAVVAGGAKVNKWQSFSELDALADKAKTTKKALEKTSAYHAGTGTTRSFFSKFKSGQHPYLTALLPHEAAPVFSSEKDAEKMLKVMSAMIRTPTYVVYPSPISKETEMVNVKTKGKTEPQQMRKESLQLSVETPKGQCEHYTIDIWKNPGKFTIKELGIEGEVSQLDAILKKKFAGVKPFQTQWNAYQDRMLAGQNPELLAIKAPGEVEALVVESVQELSEADQALLKALNITDDKVKGNFIRLLRGYNDLVKKGESTTNIQKNAAEQFFKDFADSSDSAVQKDMYRKLSLLLHPDKAPKGKEAEKIPNILAFLNACKH
jgi:hypothetical protein